MAENKVVHAAQRAAFSVAIDAAIKAVRGKVNRTYDRRGGQADQSGRAAAEQEIYRRVHLMLPANLCRIQTENGWSTRIVPSTRSILIF